MDVSMMFLLVGAITDRSLSQQERELASVLYSEYLPLIRGKAAKLTQNASDCDDLVQDCYIKLLTHIDRLIGLEQPKLIRYIERVVLTCFSEFKTHNRPTVNLERALYLMADEEPDIVQDLLEQKEIYLDFHRQFEKLSLSDQRLLYLRYIEELSLGEIAQRLGIKAISVNTELCRARKRARRLITPQKGQ